MGRTTFVDVDLAVKLQHELLHDSSLVVVDCFDVGVCV